MHSRCAIWSFQFEGEVCGMFCRSDWRKDGRTEGRPDGHFSNDYGQGHLQLHLQLQVVFQSSYESHWVKNLWFCLCLSIVEDPCNRGFLGRSPMHCRFCVSHDPRPFLCLCRLPLWANVCSQVITILKKMIYMNAEWRMSRFSHPWRCPFIFKVVSLFV